MPLEDGIAASLYMLQLAKQYITGVGGSSQITLLRDGGTIDSKPNSEVSEEENLAKQFASLSGGLLLSAMRTRTGTDEEFMSTLKNFSKRMKEFRRRKKQSDQYWDMFDEELTKLRTDAEQQHANDEPAES